MIYFIQAGEDGPVKIGYTKRAEGVKRRLTTFQTSHAETLRLLGSHEGTLEDEKELHRQFSNRRVRGEWFEPDSLILHLAGDGEYFRDFLDLARVGPRLDRWGFCRNGALTWEGLEYVSALERIAVQEAGYDLEEWIARVNARKAAA